MASFDPNQPVTLAEPSGDFDPDAPVAPVVDSAVVRRIKSDKSLTPEQAAIRIAAANSGAAEFPAGQPVSLPRRAVENAKEAFGQTLLGASLKSLQIPFGGDQTPGQELPDGAPLLVRRAKGQLNDLLAEQARRNGTATNVAGQAPIANPTYAEYPDELLNSSIERAQTRYTNLLGPNGENLKRWQTNRAQKMGEVSDKPAAAYEAMPDAQGVVQRAASVTGAVAGGLPSPENLLPIGEAKPGASLLRRVLTTGGQVAAQTAATEPLRQSVSMNAGAQTNFEPGTAVERVALGAVIGGTIEVGSTLLDKILSKFRTVKREAVVGKTPEEAAASIARETGEDLDHVSQKMREAGADFTVDSEGTVRPAATGEAKPVEPTPASRPEPVVKAAEEPVKTGAMEKPPGEETLVPETKAKAASLSEEPNVPAAEAPAVTQKFAKSTDDLVAGESFKINEQDYSVKSKNPDGSVTVTTPDKTDLILPGKTEIAVDVPKVTPSQSAEAVPAKPPRRVAVDDADAIEAAARAQAKPQPVTIDPNAPVEAMAPNEPAAPAKPAADGLVDLPIRTRDEGDSVLRVSPETKAAYDAEKAELARLQQQVKTSNWDNEQKQKDLKRIALQSAARVRQILSRQTPKEAAAAVKEANVLRFGRPVEYDIGGGVVGRGTVDRAPAFGKVRIKTEGGEIVNLDARSARVVEPTVAPKEVSRPTGRAPANIAEVADELQRAGYGDRLAVGKIVGALVNGDANLIVELTKGRKTVGDIQSAYLNLKRLGQIPDHVDRALRTGLLAADRDLFRSFDGAEVFNGAGIVALPSIDVAGAAKTAKETGVATWEAVKSAFNTTGGVSAIVFDLVDRMHNANVAAVSRVRIMSDRIARAMGRKPNELDSAAAYAFLNPSYLRQMDPAAAASLRAAANKFSPELKAALVESRAAIDTMTQKLLVMGVPKEEFATIMQNNLGRYISRSYQIFGYNKEEYISKLTTMGTPEYRLRYLPAVEKLGQDVVDKIINGIERTNEWDRAKVDQYIDESVRRLGSTAALNRTVRDQTLRDLFGEIIDPVQSVAHTLIKQQELAGTFLFRQRLSDHIVGSGMGKKIDSNQIFKDYLEAEGNVIKDRIESFVEQQRKRADTAGRPFDEAKARAFAESQNPNFDARVKSRINELRIESEAMGEGFNAEAAEREATRDVYRDTEENAYKWFRDSSGQVAPDETLLRLEDFYKNDVAMANRINDPFADLVVKNDALPFLMEYKELEPQAMSLMQEVASMANSSATVLSPMTTARNILTSWQTMMTSGNLLRAVATEDGRDAVRVAAAIAVHRIFGTQLPKDLQSVYTHALNTGVLHKGATSGISQNLVDAGLGFFKRLPKVLREKSLSPMVESGKRMRPEEAIARIVWDQEAHVAGVPLEKLTRKAQDIYQLGDDFPKIINYLNEVAKAKAVLGDTPAAMAAAKRKFDMTNFDYSRAIPIVRLARKVPFFGAFTSFISEAHRTAFNAIHLAVEDTYHGVKTGNAELTKQGVARIVGTTAALGTAAALAAMSRDALGLSHEDERNLRQYLPEWTQNSHVYWYRAKDGTVSYIDLGHPALFESVTRPAAALITRIVSGKAKDDPRDTLWNEVSGQMWNVVKPFVGLQIAPQAVIEGLSGRTANGVPIWAADDGIGDKWVKSLTHIVTSIGTPGGLKSIKTVIQGSLGQTNKLGQPIDPVKPLYNLFGMGEIEMGNGFKFFARKEGLELRGIESEFRRIAEDMSSSVSDADVYTKLAEVNERRRAAFNALTRGISVAQQVGLDRRTIMSEMKDQGFANAEIAAAFRGIYLPYTPTKETFIRARKAGRTLDVHQIRDIVSAARDPE